MMLRAEGRKSCFQLFRRRAALAADTQHRNAGDQVQRLTRRGQRQRKICAVSGGRLHTRWRRAGNSPVCGIANALPGQQCPAHVADALRLGHSAVLALGPLVHGKNAASVGGRRDDRHGMADRRQPLRQLVCAAQMPRRTPSAPPRATLPGQAAASCCASASPRAVNAMYAQVIGSSPVGTPL